MPQSPGCNTGGSGVGTGGADAGGGDASAGDANGGGGAGGASSGGSGGTPVNGGSTGVATSLIHRYSFDGSGTVAEDSVGHANGIVVNTTLDGMGGVALADDHDSKNPTADQYVDLPNQLISGLRNATLEAWLTWSGGAPWQRVFDFGDDTTGLEDNRMGNGKTYLFLTTKNYLEQGSWMRVAYVSEGLHEVYLDSTHGFPIGLKTHVAVVVDSDARQMALFMNGELESSMEFEADRLKAVHDWNVWLGRSNFNYDPCLTGTLHEFRIYSAALTASQVRESFAAGSDVVLPNP